MDFGTLKRALPLLFAGCLAGAGLRAGGALYLMGGLDGQILTNTDTNNYFDLKDGQIGPKGYPGAVVHLGAQFGRYAALEASVNGGPFEDNEVVYNDTAAGGTRQITTDWDLVTYSLTPAITYAGHGFVNMLGLRLGMATMAGHVDDDTTVADGGYDQRAMTPDIGVVFRTSEIYAGHISIGFELGYDHTVFSTITNSNGSGTYADVSGPEHNVTTVGHGGPQTSLDFSGPHAAIILGLWSNAPVHGRHGDDVNDVNDGNDANPNMPAQ